MIDINYANKHISLYKKDYHGYKVILDKITTNHILNENDLLKKRNQLNHLLLSYQKELAMIVLNEKEHIELFNDAFHISDENVIKNLKYISSRLPVIGYILIGKEKEIGL